MSDTPASTSVVRAGALRAPATFAALGLVLIGPTLGLAHGPIRRTPVTTPPPGVEVAPGTPVDAKAVKEFTPTAGGVPTTGILTIRQLAADSALVLDAVVAGTESYDEDRLRVYRLRVERTLRGHTDESTLGVVEIRGSASRPGLLADGVRTIILLRPAPPLSYLREKLPAGTYYAPAGGRDGILGGTSNAAEEKVVEETLDEGLRIATLADDQERTTARRALAFRELSSRLPRLAADALAELRSIDPLVPLTPDEVEALQSALGTKTIAASTRVGLVQLLANRGAKEAVPALRQAAIDGPAVLEALLAARMRLGAPPDRAELAQYLASKDPEVRAAAARAVASIAGTPPGDLGRLATSDPDPRVRVAAIEALGATQKAAALPTLSQTFGESEREIRQASGRAILAVGGAQASDALVTLALKGADTETRTYAALLLLVSTGRESAPVQRLLAANPSGDVRNVIEQGLSFRHSHRHEGE